MASAPTIQLNGRSDWTLMPAIHDALRRDLDELVHTTARRAAARARWVAFRDQLDFHLAAEDAALWPPARAPLTGDPHGQVSPDPRPAGQTSPIVFCETRGSPGNGPAGSWPPPAHGPAPRPPRPGGMAGRALN